MKPFFFLTVPLGIAVLTYLLEIIVHFSHFIFVPLFRDGNALCLLEGERSSKLFKLVNIKMW